MTTVTKKLASIKSGSLYAGVDLGLDSLVVVVLDADGKRVDRFKTVHSQDGYQYLTTRLERLVLQHQASGVWVGMEPTNYYWKLVGTYLSRKQIPFRLVNPYTVNKHREGDQLDKAKDDWRDGHMIADLLRSGKFTETQLRTGAYAELQIGYAGYWRLRHDRSRQVTLLTNSLRQVFPEFQQVFKDLLGRTAQAVLRSGPAAAQIRTLTRSEFVARVRQAADTQRLAVARLYHLYQLAQTSIALQDGLKSLCFEAQASLATILNLDQQSTQLFSQLQSQFEALPEAPFVCSIQGLDKSFAVGLLAETGNLGAYLTGKCLIKLAGTQPTPNSSGRFQRRKTPFSKRGRSRLRWVLYWATLRMLKRNEAIAYHYHRLTTRAKHPLTKMESIGACMNKLLWYVWATGHNRVLYEPGRWHSIDAADLA